MPLVQIHLLKGKSPAYVKAVADGVHKALCNAWQTSDDPKSRMSRFQIIHEHEKSHFFIDKDFFGVHRSEDAIILYITAVKYSAEKKKRLYQELVKVLGEHPKVRKEDIFVSLIEIDKENWFVGSEIT